jgi:hypothetical protein
MAICHASSGELIDIRPLTDKLKTTRQRRYSSPTISKSRVQACAQAKMCLRTMWRER